MFQNVLVTCVGNICRSPMAAALFASKFDDSICVKSAGIGAVQGRQADPTAINLMEERKISLSQHRARTLVRSDVVEADIIFAMEKQHVDYIKKIYPESRGKVHLLGKWIGEKDVPDPYKKEASVFSFSLKMIDKSVDEWIRKIHV